MHGVRRVKKMDVVRAGCFVVRLHRSRRSRRYRKSALLDRLLTLAAATCSSNVKNRRRERKGGYGKNRVLTWERRD